MPWLFASFLLVSESGGVLAAILLSAYFSICLPRVGHFHTPPPTIPVLFLSSIPGNYDSDAPVHDAGRVLIVCPKAVVENWKSELNTWGHFRVCVWHHSRPRVFVIDMKPRWAPSSQTYTRFFIQLTISMTGSRSCANCNLPGAHEQAVERNKLLNGTS